MSRDDRDGPREQRGNESSVLIIVLAVLGLGFLVLVVGGAAAFFFMARTANREAQVIEGEPAQPVAGFVPERVNPDGGVDRLVAGENWNHAELLAHLKGRGLKVGMKAVGGKGDEPTAYFFRSDAKFLASGVSGDQARTSDLEFELGQNAPGLALVTKKATPQAAKDEAGLHGERGWYRGRFVFRGAPKLIADIRKALE